MRARNAEQWERLYRKCDPGRMPWDVLPLFDSVQHFIDALQIDTMERALDLGCGTGQLTSRLQRETGLSFVGIDHSTRAVQLARAHHCRPGRALQFAVGDVLALPFAAGEFDLAFDRGCLHHLGRGCARKRYLDEVHRVLRPGGAFVVVAMGADRAHRWPSLTTRMSMRGVTALDTTELELLAADRFLCERRSSEITRTPLSFRFLPLHVHVVFQCHLLRRR